VNRPFETGRYTAWLRSYLRHVRPRRHRSPARIAGIPYPQRRQRQL